MTDRMFWRSRKVAATPAQAVFEDVVGSWRCPSCNKQNPISRAKCIGCSKTKPAEAFINIADYNIDPQTRHIITNAMLEGDFEVGRTGPLKMAQPQTYRRPVTKVVEVPVTRKVKVPTSTPQVVESEATARVKVKRHVIEPSYKWVEETYTDIEERPATRMKEVWIKKMVPEQYLKKVEVKKTRQVKVPTTVTKEVDAWEDVVVPTTEVVNVPGYRIDEVKDTKLMEIEGWQEIEMVPRVMDKITVERTRYLDDERRRRVERKIGHSVMLADDVPDIDTDSQPSDRPGVFVSTGSVRLDGSEMRSVAPKFRRAVKATPIRVRSAPTSEWENEQFAMFRFTLANHPNGLMIVDIKPGGYADQYNMRVGEIIRNADGRPISSLRDWRTVLRSKATNSELRLVLLSKQGETRHVKMVLDGYDPAVYRRQLGDTLLSSRPY